MNKSANNWLPTLLGALALILLGYALNAVSRGSKLDISIFSPHIALGLTKAEVEVEDAMDAGRRGGSFSIRIFSPHIVIGNSQKPPSKRSDVLVAFMPKICYNPFAPRTNVR